MSDGPSRVRLQPVFLLHQRPYRDSSELLEVLTADYGRLGVISRGSRGRRSRLRGVLRPFAPLLMSLSLRGDLATLTAAEPAAGPAGLAGETLFAAYYLNELILRRARRSMLPITQRWPSFPLRIPLLRRRCGDSKSACWRRWDMDYCWNTRP